MSGTLRQIATVAANLTVILALFVGVDSSQIQRNLKGLFEIHAKTFVD